MAMTYTWNENTPADTDLISSGDDAIRDTKKAVRERFDVEHVCTTGNEATVGQHHSGFITAASGYLADSAVTVNKIGDNAVTTVKILDANVTTLKIADTAVTTAKILDSNVTTGKIADLGVTTAKIADGAVTLVKIATTARGPGSTLDADTLDGSHAAAFATVSRGVTNGDNHDHLGGDGGTVAHSSLSSAGTTTHADIDTAVSASTSHIANTTTPHGAVSAATADKVVIRDSSGRAAFATPSATGDAATKGYVDGVCGIVETTIAASGGATVYEEGVVTHLHINGATPTGAVTGILVPSVGVPLAGHGWSTGITGGGAITIALVTSGNVTAYSFTITPSAGTHTIRVDWSWSAFTNPGGDTPTNGAWVAIAQSFRTA